MAGRAAVKAHAQTIAQTPNDIDDPSTQRAVSVLTNVVNELQNRPQRAPVTADLVVGTNKIQHGLGRAYTGYNLTVTVADATFAHAHDLSNPRPDLEVWIIVVGVAQPKARIEVY